MEGAASLAETIAAGNKAIDGSGLPPCDICSCGITPDTTYLLSTTQVVSSEDYWEQMLREKQMSDPSGDDVAGLAVMTASMSTAWSVCEKCIGLFKIDRTTSKAYSRNKQNPPGLGSADKGVACMAAAYAFSRIHSLWPKSVQVGRNPVTHDESAGRKCAFCCRILRSNDEWMGCLETHIKQFESKTGLRRRIPSVVNDGQTMWITCSKCFERFQK